MTSTTLSFIAQILAVGVFATLVMDLWTLLLRRLFGVTPLDYALVGRWLGHMSAGQFAHAGIGRSARVRGEKALGWVAHYAIGVVFAAGLILASGEAWLQSPALGPALAFGLITVVLPFFVMQPAFGAGIAASKTPKPTQARVRSLVTHSVFGLGLYAGGWLVNFVQRAVAG